MADKMIEPEIATLLDKVDNRFTLCSIVSKRARYLNDELRDAEKGARETVEASPAAYQLAHEKPVPTAVYELYEDKITYKRPAKEE